MDIIQVLLVEDEPVLASIIKESLEKRGFQIHLAANGVEGWGMYKALRPDVCVVDVMMPRKNGFSLVREIRMVDESIPVIFLTARTATEDVLKGLELGADDYMKKPFSMEELILRLKALVRRQINTGTGDMRQPDTEISIGSFRFRHRHLDLVAGSAVFRLSQREADLLLMLLQHKNSLLERNLALVKLWGENSPFTARSMDVYITRLRKLFKADPNIEISNTRGFGYSLIEHKQKK
jgi:two-component system response regulator TrcR